MRATERGTRTEDTERAPSGAEMRIATSSALVPRSDSHPGVIESRAFSFWYGQKQALKSINLTMPARSITALIGPSGCGKSTFLRSINRLNELIPGTRWSGELTLDSVDVHDAATDVVAL